MKLSVAGTSVAATGTGLASTGVGVLWLLLASFALLGTGMAALRIAPRRQA